MKNNLLSVVAVCSFLFFLSACSHKEETGPVVLDGFALGTTYHIEVRDSVREGIVYEVDSIFRAVDRSMSVFNPASLLSRINRNETDSVDRYIIENLLLARELSEESGGLYDVTIRPLTAAYGFAGGERGEPPAVDSLLELVGYDKIRIEDGRIVKDHPSIQFDLNSIAKGYTVDLIAGHFDRSGYKNYLIEVGGEIFCRGVNRHGEEWSVGIDQPFEGNFIPGAEVQAAIKVSERGLATSGNYRQYYTDEAGRKIVHTINPLTGLPAESNLLSATVVAPNAARADMVATFFMVAGLEETLIYLDSHPEIHAFLVYSDADSTDKTYHTSGIVFKE